MKKKLNIKYKTDGLLMNIIIYYDSFKSLVYTIYNNDLVSYEENTDYYLDKIHLKINNKEKTAKLIYILHRYFDLHKSMVYDILRLLK